MIRCSKGKETSPPSRKSAILHRFLSLFRSDEGLSNHDIHILVNFSLWWTLLRKTEVLPKHVKVGLTEASSEQNKDTNLSILVAK